MQQTPTSKGRLLIVDDEPRVLTSYVHSLRNAGFEVDEASDSVRALEFVQNCAFDAVFSDFSMPITDSFALLRCLKDRYPELPVILMLDAQENHAAIKGTEFGAIQSLVKPITAELLARTARYAVQICRSRRNGAASDNNPAQLETLSDEFDAMLERMQTPAARAGMEAAFNACPRQLGNAAVALARKLAG